MIEAFIDVSLPDQILFADSNGDIDSDTIEEYKSIRREELDYFTASMILLDAKYFTDKAILYFFPMLLKQIIENDGLLEPLLDRLKTINHNQLSENQSEVLRDMVLALDMIVQKTKESGNNELITLL